MSATIDRMHRIFQIRESLAIINISETSRPLLIESLQFIHEIIKKKREAERTVRFAG